MIVLNRGDDLACVCDRCLRAEICYLPERPELYPLEDALLCQKCTAVVEQTLKGFRIKHAEHPPDGKAEEGSSE